MKSPIIENLKDYGNNMFFLIAGPCVIEGEEITRSIAQTLKEITERLKVPFIFKASYKKANRSKSSSFTGIGEKEGLQILSDIRESFKIPVITDIHTADEATLAASYNIDVLQIPAFLSRQTELLNAAARTGKWINIKKGQFLSPYAMKFAVQKVEECSNKKIMLTERGSSFGYTDLIVDFRSVPIMQKSGYPVVVDVTHSLQKPNATEGVTGGTPEFIPTIAKAAVAAGAEGLFMETHPDPQNAKSDGANMLNLKYMEPLLRQLVELRKVVSAQNNIF